LHLVGYFHNCITMHGFMDVKAVRVCIPNDIWWRLFLNANYCTQTSRWSQLQMRWMRMREIPWWITSSYYLSWKHSHNAPAHYTPLEMLDVFSLCVVVEEQSVAPTNSSPAVPRTVQGTPKPPPQKKVNVYLPSLMIEVPDHVYVLFCFLTASMSVSAILVTRCAFNTIL
jgi:hypothetical protein